MATSSPIPGDKNYNKDYDNDSYDEKNSPHSSNSSVDQLTKRTLQLALGDRADTGLHKNYLDGDEWDNEKSALPGVEVDPNDNTTQPTEDDEFIQKQPQDFWMMRDCLSRVKNFCKPCLRNEHDQRPVTLMEKFKFAFLCPPAGPLAEILQLVILLLALWAVLWSITGSSGEPGGNLFALFILWIVAAILGKLFESCKLPGLLGMLIAGFIFKNVPHIQIAEDIDPKWSSCIRGIALAVILIRAGVGLDPAALRKLSCVCIRLAFLPCLCEAFTVMIVSHFILNFPWHWGLILGFVLAAVSPAVVVPCLLSFLDRNYGTAKGIPTLVIASASIDDVLAIGGFGVVLAITFSTGDLVMTILQGPLEVLIGVVYGTVVGLVLWFIPNRNNAHTVALRSFIVFLTSVFAVLGSRVMNFAGSGPLACLILAFVAAIRWRKESEGSALESIKSIYAFLWFLFQPFLFALIGAEISINSLDKNVVGYGIATLVCGLAIRICVSYISVLGAGFTWKEKLFVALAWLPKATVQAAIGPIALDYARTKSHEQNSQEISQEIEFGIQILAIAVLAILITAPIGAILIVVTGPRLLTHDAPSQKQKNGNIELESSNTQM